MSSRFDLIAQQFLQKPFSDCSIAELQQLTEAYPYLAPAHFLLAKKMQGESSALARALVQKAALYYHQPASFDAFLNSDFDEAFLYVGSEAAESLEEGAEKEWEEEDGFEPVPLVPVAAQPQPIAETAPAAMPEMEAPAATEAPKPEDQTFLVSPIPALQTGEPVFSQPAPEVEKIEEKPTPITEKNEEAPAPAPAVKKAEEKSSLPTFEPFHTVDYFASQGIRLSQEEASKDKMGKQLKSFTEWLKTMKRLPATEQLKALDPHADKKVENLAAHSVAETEIVTEAMAEVWLKQGALEKAAAVYHKLSLAHPSKSAYFAAKLESLKKQV